MLGNKEIMGRNIQYYMDLNNKSRNEVCKDLGFAYSTFSDWINAYKYPRIDKIEMMANYFGITKADLVEDRSVSISSRPSALTPDESALLDDYKKLNQIGKDKAADYVADLADNPKYQKDTGSSERKMA